MLYLLLQGLGTDIFSYIPDQLKGIFRQLRVAETDQDEVTQFQASSALAELKELLAAYLTPQEANSHSPLHIIGQKEIPRINNKFSL